MVVVSDDLKSHSTVTNKPKDLFFCLKNIYLKTISEEYCYYISDYSYRETNGVLKMKYIGQVSNKDDVMKLIGEYFI